MSQNNAIIPQWSVVYWTDSCSENIGSSENHGAEKLPMGGGQKHYRFIDYIVVSKKSVLARKTWVDVKVACSAVRNQGTYGEERDSQKMWFRNIRRSTRKVRRAFIKDFP